ncbi:hypothetical protein F444_17743, partial [Phytophthora nicotianae P1976]
VSLPRLTALPSTSLVMPLHPSLVLVLDSVSPF